MSDEQKTGKLLRVVEAYGARRERWPGDAPADAADMLHAATAREAALDAMLDTDARPASLPPALRARILSSARFDAAPARRPVMPSARWRAAAMVTVLVTGVAAGYAGAAAAFTADRSGETLLGLALAAPDDPFAAFVEDDA